MIVYQNHPILIIETSVDEPDEQLKEFVDTIIVSIYQRIPEWLTFEFGRRFERRGIIYREFLCRSGSVHFRILVYAKNNNLARAIIMRGTRENAPICYEIRAGIRTEFNCDELNPVPMPDGTRPF
jgi:hypothetical protein